MTIVLELSVLAVTIFAAMRSTWSPCGLSMLSTLTPIGERGRGNPYRITAASFIVGGLLGGAALGAACAALAAAYSALGAPRIATAAVAVGACLLAATSDAEVGGIRLPVHRRQVNEDWLDQFRSWVYGLGFGWQVGVGLATYITTSAVYLMIMLAALTADPVVAFAAGSLFGLARGTSVLFTARIHDPSQLVSFHRSLGRLGRTARRAVIAVDVAVAAMVLGAIWTGPMPVDRATSSTSIFLIMATVFVIGVVSRKAVSERQQAAVPATHSES